MPEDTAPHLLVVDDDARIRSLLQKYLMRNGFWVTTARDAAHARRVLSGLAFDLLVLDVMMPGEDGMALTRAIRQGSSVPILLLTARGAPDDRIDGLEAGADDYLPKPFEPRELVLRINAILRRSPGEVTEPARPQVLFIGPLRYDLDKGVLKRGDDPIRLTQTEAALMRLFAQNPGEVLSREALVDYLGRDRAGHGGEVGQERAVDVQITRLRRKIESDPKSPRHLQTVRGAGYMLVVE
ncbi:MAG: two component signal transduction system response regulator PetR [Roseibaca calidilacus]|uniref:Two component signal transduction system response regulator PetR n=1 Tax=Roseibaca calidilacus TaxID=1666912 RepID=A0A0P7W397_9RHOB|nr:response regulator transcription factor [Roseibaca calidilacus]KPP90734.1 MAG: two component signal transduction system response regulator PetR [Roseibaca calidilacus]CUX83470.1 two-component system, OmpR family, phosphate regulon response regulator OmpR [Roseibaca calidilacus]